MVFHAIGTNKHHILSLRTPNKNKLGHYDDKSSSSDWCWNSSLTANETRTCLTKGLAESIVIFEEIGSLPMIFDFQYPTLSSGIVDSCEGSLFP